MVYFIHMVTDTSKRILEFIESKDKAQVKEIVEYLGFSRQAVSRQLNKLQEQNQIYKIGKPPKVFYSIKKQKSENKEYNVKEQIRLVIEKNFLTITVTGEIKKGWEGFIIWCHKRKQDVEKVAVDYYKIIKKYKSIRKNGLLDGMVKMNNTFSQVYLDNVFYLDFYAIEHFGKTKLGQMLLYAKQSQNKAMIKELTNDIKPRIKQLIKEYKIDAVGFIPPTVKREVQFMKELENNLAFRINKIKITKIKTPVIVPQKTLNKLADRIENANKTFVVGTQPKYKNILLIDDAVGSGATLNEIARQIKQKDIVQNKIIGLVITGSLKGFDVISEV